MIYQPGIGGKRVSFKLPYTDELFGYICGRRIGPVIDDEPGAIFYEVATCGVDDLGTPLQNVLVLGDEITGIEE